ncbi:MAG: hypothetical protein ACOWWM_15780 [Desulfobacterales bacterium]
MPVFVLELLLAAFVAVIVSLAYAGIGRRRRRTGFIWFFLIVLAATWAGGVWLKPFGPMWLGVHWVPFSVVGLVFLLLVLAFVPQRPPEGRHETLDKLEEIAREKQLEEVTYVTLGTVFWALLIILLLAVTARYLTQ